MFAPSKKVVIVTLTCLSLSTCAPVLCAADEPQASQAQSQAESVVTEEQIRKDWPQVMRMVTRTNEKIDLEEKIQRLVRITGGAILVGMVVGGIVIFLKP